jgi:hypothetical protein
MNSVDIDRKLKKLRELGVVSGIACGTDEKEVIDLAGVCSRKLKEIDEARKALLTKGPQPRLGIRRRH